MLTKLRILSVSESIAYILTYQPPFPLLHLSGPLHRCHRHLSQAKLEAEEIPFEIEDRERKRLEKPFADMEMECNQIQERRRLAEEKRREEIRVLELKTKAAIVVQAWWRGYSVRKALKNKGKSTKAKKGKGKSKGKKAK